MTEAKREAWITDEFVSRFTLLWEQRPAVSVIWQAWAVKHRGALTR